MSVIKDMIRWYLRQSSPGCPPHPITILDGLLRLLGRIEDRA